MSATLETGVWSRVEVILEDKKQNREFQKTRDGRAKWFRESMKLVRVALWPAVALTAALLFYSPIYVPVNGLVRMPARARSSRYE
jgi:hypothetical protein